MQPTSSDVVLDGTVGLGGHAAAIAPLLGADGRYIGLDLDPAMLARARDAIGTEQACRIDLEQANYAEFPKVLARLELQRVDAMLLDLGVNSAQLDDPARGFSFDRDGPLDMRFDQSDEKSALELVNGSSESELADLFYEYGQEGASRKIAKRICQVRHSGRITTTVALARAIESAGGPSGKTHPATRVFQALRIAVNRELQNVEQFCDAVVDHLAIGGKLLVISFHSLEDKIVKQFLRNAARAGTMRELTKRPIMAEPKERRINPRSRSAKMRVAERIDNQD